MTDTRTSAWTAKDIPDQGGRTAVVTGANTGLGLETARQLAAHGASVVLAVRNLDKGKSAADDIARTVRGAQVELQQLDLGSLDSVRAAASELHDRVEKVDLLINNAGVMYTPRQKTADGFEMQFGTNHLGHFAWTGQVIDLLLGVEGSRIVTVSSVGHRILSAIDLDDLQAEKHYNRVSAYGRSKLSNLLFTYELQRRLADSGVPTQALAAHPGVSDTELARHMPGSKLLQPLMKVLTQDAAMGALPTLRAATDPAAVGGQYYGPDGFMEYQGNPVLVTSSSRSHDTSLQSRLWEASEELTGVTFPIHGERSP